MPKICEFTIPTKVVECDPIVRSFIRTHQIVVIAGRKIEFTLIYEVRLIPLGIGVGRHLYALTLLPGEEIEIEMFRQSKTTTELHEGASTELESSASSTAPSPTSCPPRRATTRARRWVAAWVSRISSRRP
jgi:hypothetical protein